MDGSNTCRAGRHHIPVLYPICDSYKRNVLVAREDVLRLLQEGTGPSACFAPFLPSVEPGKLRKLGLTVSLKFSVMDCSRAGREVKANSEHGHIYAWNNVNAHLGGGGKCRSSNRSGSIPYRLISTRGMVRHVGGSLYTGSSQP